MSDSHVRLKYWILRFRDALFPPRSLSELWDYRLKRGKYSYLAEKQQMEIQKAWRKRFGVNFNS